MRSKLNQHIESGSTTGSLSSTPIPFLSGHSVERREMVEIERALACRTHPWLESMAPFAGVSRVSFRLWALLCFEQPAMTLRQDGSY